MKRFLKYCVVGFSTFLIDLGLLFLFTDIFHVQYVVSAGIAFILGTSVTYFLSRTYVFKGTLRDFHSGYVFFLLIGTGGLLIVTIGMYVAVEFFDLHYLLSRILIAGFGGLWNYLMNFYVNFRVSQTQLRR